MLTPMGWDAFGLPAENAAIKTGTPPAEYTRSNIAMMKEQLRAWGCSYDWEKEVTSCLPDYYKWTQWLFLRFYEKGLAYKQNSNVNWCPSCATVLANEPTPFLPAPLSPQGRPQPPHPKSKFLAII